MRKIKDSIRLDNVRRSNRESHYDTYHRNHPEIRVRKETLNFLTKKEEYKEVMEGKEPLGWQGEMLDDLLAKIRDILTKGESK